MASSRSRSSSEVNINTLPASSDSTFAPTPPSQDNFTLNPALLDNFNSSTTHVNQVVTSPPLYTNHQHTNSASSFLHPESARRQSEAANSIAHHTFLQSTDNQQPDHFTQGINGSTDFSASQNSLGAFDGINPQLLTNIGASDSTFDIDSSLMSPGSNIPLEAFQETPQSQMYSDDMNSYSAQSPSPAPMQQQYHNHSRHPSISSVHSASSYNYNNVPFPNYHSRSASLTPAGVAYDQQMMNNNGNWTSPPYQQPRQFEDHADFMPSPQPSPFLGAHNSFTPSASASPYLNPANEIPDGLQNFNDFNLADGDMQFPGDFQSDEQLFPTYGNMNNMNNMNGSFDASDVGLGFTMPMNQNGTVVYPTPDAFPMITHQESNEMSPGLSSTMSPPNISIDFAPPQKQPSFPMPQMFEQSLDPPNHGRQRSSTTGSDARSPSNHRAGRSRAESLTVPDTNRPHSRSPSPGSATRGISKSRRQSNPVLSNPERLAEAIAIRRSSNASQISNISEASNVSSNGGGSPDTSGVSPSNSISRQRVGPNGLKQKNPSSYHCKLCPKSFTRAYNLRSHERTHSGVRPYICGTCAKTFARQHDRKRHEELHTGVKKFVCHGKLKDGSEWGCGKGFARADALGRHFKSEQGRACIAPIFTEEANDRQADLQEQQRLDLMNQQGGVQSPQLFVPTGNTGMPQMPSAPLAAFSASNDMPALPAAVLQMYPALATLQWGSMTAPVPGDDDDHSGLDVSDFGEYSGGSDVGEDFEWTGNGEGQSVGNQYLNGFDGVGGMI